MALLKGIIFDLDGTLVDSGRAHARAWAKAFQQWNILVDQNDVRQFIGLHPEQLVRKLMAGTTYHYSKIFQLIESHNRIFLSEEARNVRPLAGARHLVAKLADVGTMIEIASGASKGEIEAVLKISAVEKYFKNDIDTPGQVISSNTESLELAANRMGLLPSDCVLIGSSPYAVEAANRLRMACIALRSGGWNNASLRDAKAIYDDLEDLWFRFNTSCLRETYLACKAVKLARQSISTGHLPSPPSVSQAVYANQ